MWPLPRHCLHPPCNPQTSVLSDPSGHQLHHRKCLPGPHSNPGSQALLWVPVRAGQVGTQRGSPCQRQSQTDLQDVWEALAGRLGAATVGRAGSPRPRLGEGPPPRGLTPQAPAEEASLRVLSRRPSPDARALPGSYRPAKCPHSPPTPGWGGVLFLRWVEAWPGLGLWMTSGHLGTCPRRAGHLSFFARTALI